MVNGSEIDNDMVSNDVKSSAIDLRNELAYGSFQGPNNFGSGHWNKRDDH